MNLAQHLERAIDKLTLVGAVGVALTIGFLLCLFSFFIKIGIYVYNPDVPNKEVGFLSAPNWTIVYMVLFPLYLAFFSTIISSIKAFFNNSVAYPELRVITGPGGVAVGAETVASAWDIQLKRLSILVLVLFLGVTISSGLQWFYACFEPFWRARQGVPDFLGGEVWDWSTVPYQRRTQATPEATVIFTGIAYFYMALALFVYLAILAYCAYFASFMSRLADDTDRLRLVIRGTEPTNFIAEFFTYVYTLAFLGLCAGYFMRLQASYLSSDQTTIFRYWFSDVRCWLYAQCTSLSGLQITASSFTSLLEATYTLIMLAVCIMELARAYSRSKRYYLQKIGDPAWRRTMRIRYDAEFVSDLKKESFLRAVIPHYPHLAIPIILMIGAIVFPHVGTLFVLAVLYAAVTLVRGNPNQWNRALPEAEPEDSPHFKPLDISENDREDIILLLQHQASIIPHALLPDRFYANVIDMSDIPAEYKNNIKMKLKNNPDPAAALVDATIDQGQNIPQLDIDKKNSTILGSILIELKEQLGLDFQCIVVGKLQRCSLIANQLWLNELNQQTCGLLPRPYP
ncbi:hypothetical protein R1521_09450 [Rhizobium brockwellii]|uniref:Uncharacterized protein n=1 Tax=Rhizobium brockwellii TaxID=3019932 RepID=A0ABU3YIP6_9HYPH|nr:hypothetical protein [Rhizobium brockwellii]MDV4178730.1 hypothetical protein [Rhizobium brockwellii]MDV4185728.1 hypothetical protein [Rhizobium brockwellii]